MIYDSILYYSYSYRDTPTAAGPNSFGKGRLGFVDRNKAIEREIQKKLEELGEG